QIALIDLQTQPNNDSQSGVGASEDSNGRVGFAKGRGEGSGPTLARAQGGGGGGGGIDGRKGESQGGSAVHCDIRELVVTSRARVISKPEPQYTEEARRNQITGRVVLSVVFDRSGQVTNIRAVQTLCCGLTEKAIAAARQIRFIPAMRNGQVVSTYMQLE